MSQELWGDPMNYLMENGILDLTYSGIDPQDFLTCLSQMHIKDNGKYSSVSKISKFYDALSLGPRYIRDCCLCIFSLKLKSHCKLQERACI